MRKILLVVCLLAVATMVSADEWDELIVQLERNWQDKGPRDPARVDLARRLLNQYPLRPDVAGNRRLEEQYGVICLFLVCDAASKGGYQQAVALANDYLAAVPVPMDRAGAAVGMLQLRYFLKTSPTRDQTTGAARACAYRMLWGSLELPWSWWGRNRPDRDWHGPDFYVDLVVKAYQQADELSEAMEFLRLLPVHHPNLLTEHWYWKQTVATCLSAGDPDKAKQAALTAFRICPFKERAVNEALQLLYKTLVVSGDVAQMQAFMKYLKEGQGDNPFGQVPLPELSEDECQQLYANTGGDFHYLVSAYLYTGRPADAALTAREELFLGSKEAAQNSADDIARSFKAKDMHCHRANQFIEYLRTGQGPNPLEAF